MSTIGPFIDVFPSSDDEENEEGTEEDIEVEAEIEEADTVSARQDELAGLELLASRFLKVEKISTPYHDLEERPIQPKPR